MIETPEQFKRIYLITDYERLTNDFTKLTPSHL